VIEPGRAPPPTSLADGRTVVAAEVVSLDAALSFDAALGRASVEATLVLLAEDASVAFDLRQPVASARLDGAPVPAASMGHTDLGGGTGAQMRVLDLGSRGPHRLELAYELGTPDVEDPLPVRWAPGRVGFDVWCSDLYPGRYLEQWLPVSLCQDRFALRLSVAVTGAGSRHSLLSNGQVSTPADHRWEIAWPANATCLSALVVLAPDDELRRAELLGPSGVRVEVSAESILSDAPVALAERVAGWLDANQTAYGAYHHGDRFIAHAWASARGMEYDGATTGSVGSLEHEVFHSWFGRGVKPASANDGWIDEAFTTWSTSDHEEAPRLAAMPLGLDEEPVVLCPASPWSRFTPREAYRMGYRVFADLAARSSVDAVQEAMAQMYRERAGGFLSTAELEVELGERLGVDLGPTWDRYVRGLPHTPEQARR